MQDLLRAIRAELMSTPDSVCLERAWLVTEAWQQHDGQPTPLLRAKAFAHVLARMSLDLRSNPIFAGNTSSRPRAWMVLPEHGFRVDPQVALECPELAGILDDAIPGELRESWRGRSGWGGSGIGHLAVDHERVVHHGLESVLDELNANTGAPGTPEQLYRDAMTIAVRAVCDWAARYARAAAEAACSEADPLRRACLRRVAEACRRVPAKPARNLFEALQAMLLVQLAVFVEGHGMSVSLGLPDRVCEPFCREPFDADEATDLLVAFLLKLNAVSLYGRGSKTQAITVGGRDHLGRDRSNPLTHCFLEACERARVGDPHLFLRWHKGMAPALRRRACKLLASGLSMPLLIADEPTAAGFIHAGASPEDAYEYCVIGCNELGIPGRSATSAASLCGNTAPLQDVCAVLAEVTDADSITGTADLLPRIEARCAARLRESRRHGHAHRARLAERLPTPFTSALMRGCPARGQDLMLGMTYHFPGLYERGLANAANALAAIEQVVFEERKLSLAELAAAVREDFQDPAVARWLRAATAWGNDDDRADRWALALVDVRERALDAIDAEFGDPPHMVCHVVRSLNLLDGQQLGASPDGRHAGAPLGDSLGAVTGTAREGPLAVLRSVLKLDTRRYYRGGTNLNLTLGAGATPESVEAIVTAFFEQGGQELQLNRLCAEDLRAARREPARHGDLIVRFAGFTARFVDLSPVHQEELIARAEAG